jgi:hypothetical protein
MKTKIFKLIVKYFNLKQFLKDMVNEVLDEALEKVVQSTATPFDNAAKAALYPEVEKSFRRNYRRKSKRRKMVRR